MHIHSTFIENTFAEAFPMTAVRLVLTAVNERWLRTAASEITGYATSVIGCDTEAGVERWLSEQETPDRRPGASLLFFAFSRDGLQKALVNRVGQCLLTCPLDRLLQRLTGYRKIDSHRRSTSFLWRWLADQ